jgi:hypothetical protein
VCRAVEIRRDDAIAKFSAVPHRPSTIQYNPYQYNPYQYDPVQRARSNQHVRARLADTRAHSSSVHECSVWRSVGSSPVGKLLGHVNPLGTRAGYDEVKRAAETPFFDYYRQHRVRIKIACIFNAYGPRMQQDGGGFSVGWVFFSRIACRFNPKSKLAQPDEVLEQTATITAKW